MDPSISEALELASNMRIIKPGIPEERGADLYAPDQVTLRPPALGATTTMMPNTKRDKVGSSANIVA